MASLAADSSPPSFRQPTPRKRADRPRQDAHGVSQIEQSTQCSSAANGRWALLRFFEIALVLVRLDHLASIIVNSNQRIMRPAVEVRIANRVRDSFWPVIPESPEGERIGNQIDAAMIFTRSDLSIRDRRAEGFNKSSRTLSKSGPTRRLTRGNTHAEFF
jgi:hypothetical protein